MSVRRGRTKQMRWVAAVAIATLTLGGASARAQIANVYEVRGVAVDVTAETAAKAREQALAEGQLTAFQRLLQRLTLRADHGRLPKPTREAVQAYVQDLAVAEEKASPVRYIASLTYRFNAQAVRRLLIDRGLSFCETPSKPVLVLPVYRAAGTLLLWDDPNPWRTAWREAVPSGGLVPFAVPLGDLSDIATIGPEQAVGGETSRLAAVAARYDAGDALVAEGTLGVGSHQGLPRLEVTVTRHGRALGEQTLVATFDAGPGETVDDLLHRAALEVALMVEDAWKRDNLLKLDRLAIIAVSVPVTALADWLEMRRRLEGVAVVQRLDLVLMSRDQIRLNIRYFGDPDQLALALAQADLTLLQEDGQYVVSFTGRKESGGGGRTGRP